MRQDNVDDIRSPDVCCAFQSAHPAAKRLPRRTSLVEETATALKAWIQGGVLTELLPGELQLKTRLGVGRDTLRLALKQLAREGWVSSSTRGCQRRVGNKKRSARNRAGNDDLPVTCLSTHPVEHGSTLLGMEDTQRRLAEQGRKLHFVSPYVFQLRRPQRELERLVRARPSAAWVLCVTSESIQRWFDRRALPALLYEMPFSGVRLPFVAPDWEGAAFHAGLQLVRNGHRVIALLNYRDCRPGFLREQRGLERALNAAGSAARLELFPDEGTPASVARSLESAFCAREHPTALILTRAAQLLTCYSWLASRGLRVPEDVSIVSLANDSWFAHLHPPVCHYEPDSTLMSRSIADRVMELVSTGGLTQKSLRVRLDYSSGATIGAAHAENANPLNRPPPPLGRYSTPAGRTES